jgi:flagellar hook protein FlgE
MQSVSAIAVSGMTSAVSSLGSSAHNLANLGTTGFNRELSSFESLPGGGVTARVERAPQSGNAIEADMVGLLAAKHSFLTNLAVFRASDAMAGVLLDIGA